MNAGAPIPDDAGKRKSFSIKPPHDAADGASSMGILSLGCSNKGSPQVLRVCTDSQGWVWKLYSVN